MVNRLGIDGAGRLVGRASIAYNSPWPCPNGSWGMRIPQDVMGIIMHTMVGNLAGTIGIFNNPSYQASAHFGIDQSGNIHQFGPVNGWVAWHIMNGNHNWIGIEHADNGNPDIPLTAAQIQASAQIVEAVSSRCNFPLQLANNTGQEGYGVHYMGGAAWGGHSCPDISAKHVRSRQRPEILAMAAQLRGGGAVVAINGYHITACPPGRWVGKGMLTAHGTDGNTWYTATNNGKTWTAPSRSVPTIGGTYPYTVSTIPPGWWKGTAVFGGTGTDKNRWHTSTGDGTGWNPPQK